LTIVLVATFSYQNMIRISSDRQKFPDKTGSCWRWLKNRWCVDGSISRVVLAAAIFRNGNRRRRQPEKNGGVADSSSCHRSLRSYVAAMNGVSI
jgi:hypothetical protein